MENIANLLFEAEMLKSIPRSGYQFLGKGTESVAEHSFIITFISLIMSRIEPDIDAHKLVSMCIVHDLPESRIGDLNSVNKKYVHADEEKAVADMVKDIPFGQSLTDLIKEFNEGKTREAKLARDADQLGFLLDLKALADKGSSASQKWMPYILKRIKTDTGKMIAEGIIKTDWDNWWFKDFAAENKTD